MAWPCPSYPILARLHSPADERLDDEADQHQSKAVAPEALSFFLPFRHRVRRGVCGGAFAGHPVDERCGVLASWIELARIHVYSYVRGLNAGWRLPCDHSRFVGALERAGSGHESVRRRSRAGEPANRFAKKGHERRLQRKVVPAIRQI